MQRLLVTAAFIASCACLASAQTHFRATLDGHSEVPPVSTKASGWATFDLNSDNTLTYFVNTQGLVGTAAHIHDGDAGSDGGIVFPLSGGPDIYSGSTPALNGSQLDTLRANGLYVNVHTAANPDGEIRGQIVPRPILFGARLVGGQVVPPVTTNAVGDADFTVNGDNTITFNVTITGVSGTDAHIHTGAFGQTGPILFTLSGGPTSWSGTTDAMSVDDFTALQSLGLYVDVHTSANPNGEIRGQIVPGLSKYGTGCDSSLGKAPGLFGLGAPTPGGTITVKINDGLPSGLGVLAQSLAADAVAVAGCGYYLGAPQAFTVVKLGAGGELKFSVSALPDLPTFDLYVQFFGFDSGAPNGMFYASNALFIPYTKL